MVESIKKDRVFLEEFPVYGVVTSWPVALIEGQVYYAEGPQGRDWIHGSLPHTNRLPISEEDIKNSLVLPGPVVNLDSAERNELVFLEEEDGKWRRETDEYWANFTRSELEEGQTNG